MAGREVCLLESFCGLKMCVDIRDCLLVKSFAENCGIQEVYFFVRDFSRKFNCRMATVCLDNKLFYLLFVNIPQREYVTDVSFPRKWSKSVLLYYCLTEHAKPDQCLSLTKIYQISLFATYHCCVQRGDNETWLVRL